MYIFSWIFANISIHTEIKVDGIEFCILFWYQLCCVFRICVSQGIRFMFINSSIRYSRSNCQCLCVFSNNSCDLFHKVRSELGSESNIFSVDQGNHAKKKAETSSMRMTHCCRRFPFFFFLVDTSINWKKYQIYFFSFNFQWFSR